MTTRIVPSDSYIRFLVPPISQSAPEHMKKIIPGYIITHVLGSGGFATIYKAINPDGWEVAVKIPKIDDLKKTLSMDVIEKFKFESDIWRNLKQDHIVDFFDSNTIPLPYISMELMEGGDLDALMKNHRLTVGEAVRIMLQVLEGMSYAHRMASVHRDLKPENILFSSDGIAKITDWGIGKYMASEGITKTIETKGTLAYSSPEQYDTKKFGKVDWQTDIFQLGTVFYEMLTGVNPFSGPRMPGEVIGRVLNHDPEPPSSHNRDIPSELDDIVMGALEKDKKKRWDSGAVMLHEIKGLIEGKVRSRRVKHKETGEKGQSEGVIRELGKQFDLLRKIGVDTSSLELEMKPLEKYLRLRWYDKVIEQGNVLLEELKKRYKKEQERQHTERKALMEKVRKLFEECLSRELDIEHLYDSNDEAMEAYERGDHEKAERLFHSLKKDLERLIDEDNRREAAWKKFDRLKTNSYRVPAPRGLEDLIERDVYRAEGELVGWADAIEKARKEEERRKRGEEERIEREKEEKRRLEAERRREKEEQRRREDEARRKAEVERRRREEEERHRRRVQGLGEKAIQLNKKRAGYRINIDNLREDLQSASTLLKVRNLQKAEDKYNDIQKRLETAIEEYEAEEEAAEKVRIKEQQKKQLNKIIIITSIAVVVLLIGSGIGGYVWYSWDSDDDGIRDAEDAFPNDPAASIDTDGDGWPDEWNRGKNTMDSTSKIKLYLDAFPNDPAVSIDSDKDGWPDEWNEGKSYVDSTTGLHLDAFPGNKHEWVDSDGDGYGDNHADKFPDNKDEWVDSDDDGIGDNYDKFPNDPAASIDIDGDGYPYEWNDRMSISDSNTGLHLDVFPNDPAASVDTDKDGYPDEWNEGMNLKNSTTGLKLDELPEDSNEWADTDRDGIGDNSDAFPNDPAASVDTDSDGFPNDWNEGKTKSVSTTGLELDKFPNDRAAGKDTDNDGSPDEWVNEMSEENSTTGLYLDTFPIDPAASVDTDEDGFPNEWNSGKDAADSTSNPPLRLDDFPNDPAASLDSDGDGWPDEWNEGKFQSDSTTGLEIDELPSDSDEWVDTDGDGYGDNKADKFPNNPTLWKDSDDDGIADKYEEVVETININNVSFTFVSINSGTFMMGSNWEDNPENPNQGKGYDENEQPIHQVTISKGFQMLKYEVTQSQWREVVNSTPWKGENWVKEGDDYPAIYISWDDSQNFISELNKLDLNHTYRLPTEAEWEYTCRAGSDTEYCFSDDEARLGEYAWFEENTDDVGERYAHRVGQKKPNAWGLYDMHGNLWEWCQDRYNSDYYKSSPGTDPQGANSSSNCVIRGGYWCFSSNSCRSATRGGVAPDVNGNHIGLRIVREET